METKIQIDEEKSIMVETKIDKKLLKRVLTFQKNEITGYHIYLRLAKKIKDEENKKILQSIANDELNHFELLKDYTRIDTKPSRFKIIAFYWMSRIFGLTFSLKLLENIEERNQVDYKDIEKIIPDTHQIILDEEAHEKELLNLINEERLNYVGSMVLGLNDALVELTGTLAGLTFAFQNTKLIALSGLITGIAASLSMAVSEYLSTKTEGGEKNALKSSLYTGAAYIITVILLVLPYLFIQNYFSCLVFVLIIALIIIFVFNFYVSVAKDYSFKKRFFEMAGLSLGVAIVSFLIGILLRELVGVEI